MVDLKKVIEFINSSDLAEFNKIRFAVDRRRSELRNDQRVSFNVGDTVLIKKDDLLEYSQGGKKYYMLEGQWILGKVIG